LSLTPLRTPLGDVSVIQGIDFIGKKTL
jgi:hypothetical protein